MDCSKVVEKLSFYVDGEIDEHTLEAVEAHLEHCPACRREHAALATLTQAASGIEAVEPPAGLRERVVQAARSSSQQDRRCARVRGLLSARVDGELSDRKNALVSAHLSECEDCAAEVESLGVLARAARSIEPIEPPSSLRGRIAAAVASEPAGLGSAARLREIVAIGSLRWAGGAAAAALTALVVISIFGGQPQPASKATVTNKNKPAAVVSAAPVIQHPSAAWAAPSSGLKPAVAGSGPTVRQVHRQVRRAEPTVAAAPAATRIPVPPPAPKLAAPRPIEAEPEPNAEAAVTGATPEPVEVAVAAEPEPQPAPEPKKVDRPVPTRVAVAAFTEDAKEWAREIKTEAAMRKGEPRGGFQLVTSRF